MIISLHGSMCKRHAHLCMCSLYVWQSMFLQFTHDPLPNMLRKLHVHDTLLFASTGFKTNLLLCDIVNPLPSAPQLLWITEEHVRQLSRMIQIQIQSPVITFQSRQKEYCISDASSTCLYQHTQALILIFLKHVMPCLVFWYSGCNYFNILII